MTELPDPINLLETTDATVWAKQFIDSFGHRPEQIDYDLMVTWFANAIQTGRSHLAKDAIHLLESSTKIINL